MKKDATIIKFPSVSWRGTLEDILEPEKEEPLKEIKEKIRSLDDNTSKRMAKISTSKVLLNAGIKLTENELEKLISSLESIAKKLSTEDFHSYIISEAKYLISIRLNK